MFMWRRLSTEETHGSLLPFVTADKTTIMRSNCYLARGFERAIHNFYLISYLNFNFS